MRNPLAVGLNCALGAKELRQYVEELSGIAEVPVSCYPNAGLPNAFGEYDDTPESMAKEMGAWARAGFLNLAGGCCGTAPEHIHAIAEAVRGVPPRKRGQARADAAPVGPGAAQRRRANRCSSTSASAPMSPGRRRSRA